MSQDRVDLDEFEKLAEKVAKKLKADKDVETLFTQLALLTSELAEAREELAPEDEEPEDGDDDDLLDDPEDEDEDGDF